MTSSMASPSIAALPLAISTAGVKGPTDSDLAPRSNGTMEATVVMATSARTAPEASENWFRTLSSELSSAPRAASTATMDRRPLMSSGAGPEKAIRSPNDGVLAIVSAVTEDWTGSADSTTGADSWATGASGASVPSSAALMALTARRATGEEVLATKARVVATVAIILNLKRARWWRVEGEQTCWRVERFLATGMTKKSERHRRRPRAVMT